jgi:hypothetical protein
MRTTHGRRMRLMLETEATSTSCHKQMARKRFSTEWTTILVSALLLVPAIAEGAPFPAQLFGKSVTLRWTANRQAIFESSDETVLRSWRSVLNIYISGAGRAFSKEEHLIADGRQTAAAQAPDESRNSWGGDRVVHFEDGALLVDSLLVAGARHIFITFDAGYGSCNARVIYGREGGTGPIRQRSKSSGRRFEVVSIHNSTSSCSITSGNVFGDQ